MNLTASTWSKIYGWGIKILKECINFIWKHVGFSNGHFTRWLFFSTVSRFNWNLGFCGERKTRGLREKPSEWGQEPTTNSTQMWQQVQESLPHPFSLLESKWPHDRGSSWFSWLLLTIYCMHHRNYFNSIIISLIIITQYILIIFMNSFNPLNPMSDQGRISP